MILAFCAIGARAQFYGTVIDASNGETIPFATAKYIGTSEGRQSDIDGNFVLPILNNYNKFEVSCLGYKSVTVTVNRAQSEIHSTIKLYPEDFLLTEVVVNKSKIKYSRKNNPAVELMRKVIANKKLSDIKEKDFYHPSPRSALKQVN